MTSTVLVPPRKPPTAGLDLQDGDGERRAALGRVSGLMLAPAARVRASLKVWNR